MSGFFAMGGYEAYVWPAYAVSLFGLLAAIVWTVRDYRRARNRLHDLENRSP